MNFFLLTQVEANNLNFIRFRQPQLRVEKYCVMDHYEHNILEEEDDALPGHVVILPSSFYGSPRNMRERYHDAMAIVRHIGAPDLFITITCNPHWDEIVENLFPGQNPSDRPDLIARVFCLKLKRIIQDICKEEQFGKVTGYAYSIEFQKRGLPHCHMLIILDNHCKMNTVETNDQYISAELPNPKEEPLLWEIVTKHMIHGPCGVHNLKSPCMDNGQCTKKFPKPFQNETQVAPDGYPLYRRRKRNDCTSRSTIDNSFVVPYNRELLLKYNTHINVEACASIKAVKYIFKYIYKGYDKAQVVVTASEKTSNVKENKNHDEIKQYLDTRYISAPEAMWDLLEFKRHDKSHTIVRLAVHLPFEQLLYFQEGKELEALKKAAQNATTLTGWFELNKKDATARSFHYTDIPYNYVWDREKYQWKKRQQRHNSVIPRMYTVGPKAGERFFLRLLLLHVTGKAIHVD